jgi:hypothetical protein
LQHLSRVIMQLTLIWNTAGKKINFSKQINWCLISINKFFKYLIYLFRME